MSSLATPATRPPVSSPKFFGRSFGDSHAHLFFEREALECGILPAHHQQVTTIIETGLLQELCDDGFMARTRPGVPRDIYPLIFAVESPEVLSYCYEWSYAAWKQAILFWIDFLSLLATRGYTVRNPHPWNLTYDGSAFRYLNPGSFVTFDPAILERSWEKILRFFVRPLIMASFGYGPVARHLLRDVHEGVPAGLVQKEYNNAWTLNISDLPQTWAAMRARCVALEVPDSPAKWDEYYEERRFHSGSSWNLKRECMQRLLSEIVPNRILDLGGNTGYYSKAAAERGHRAICIDVDDTYVSRLHRDLQSKPASIIPLVMDFTNPAPGLGVNNDWFPAATQRLKSEMVLAFALEHHLVFGKYRLNFDQFARGVWSFSSKCAVVEFVPPYANLKAAEWRPECTAWYHIDGFRDAFHRYFNRVEEISVGPDNRRLLRCDDPREQGQA